MRDLDHKPFLNEQTFCDYRSVDVHDVLAKLSIKVDRKQESKDTHVIPLYRTAIGE